VEQWSQPVVGGYEALATFVEMTKRVLPRPGSDHLPAWRSGLLPLQLLSARVCLQTLTDHGPNLDCRRRAFLAQAARGEASRKALRGRRTRLIRTFAYFAYPGARREATATPKKKKQIGVFAYFAYRNVCLKNINGSDGPAQWMSSCDSRGGYGVRYASPASCSG